jgi:hypothetical protein
VSIAVASTAAATNRRPIEANAPAGAGRGASRPAPDGTAVADEGLSTVDPASRRSLEPPHVVRARLGAGAADPAEGVESILELIGRRSP